VVPEHRGRQLTKRLYQFLIPKLKESGVTQCLLEVIQENKPAFEVYKNIGFQVTRSLDSFRATKEDLLLTTELPEDITINLAKKPDWSAYQHLGEVAPSWQNTAAAFTNFPDAKMVLEARTSDKRLAGFIAFLVGNGAILQLAVDPKLRCQGIGTALLRGAAAKSESKSLMLINMDEGASDFIAFLNRRYLKRFLGQYEMLMPLE